MPLNDPKLVMDMKNIELVRLCKRLNIQFDQPSDQGRSQYVEALLQRLSRDGKFNPAKAVRSD